MAHVYDHDDPEQMIATLNRNRQIKMVVVVAGLVIAFGAMFAVTAAMYSGDPAEQMLGAPAK